MRLAWRSVMPVSTTHVRPAAPQRIGEEVEALDHLVVIAAEEHVRPRPACPAWRSGWRRSRTRAAWTRAVSSRQKIAGPHRGRRLGRSRCTSGRGRQSTRLLGASGKRGVCNAGLHARSTIGWAPKLDAAMASEPSHLASGRNLRPGTPVRSRSRRFHEQRAD